MQHALICNSLIISLFLFYSALFNQEKFQAMELFCTVLPGELSIKPPSHNISNKIEKIHDIALNNNTIIAKPRTFFCLAQMAMLKTPLANSKYAPMPIILFNYHINGYNNNGLEIMSDETFFDLDTDRYWHYYIFQVKENKTGRFSIALTPNYKHFEEKVVEVIVL